MLKFCCFFVFVLSKCDFIFEKKAAARGYLTSTVIKHNDIHLALFAGGQDASSFSRRVDFIDFVTFFFSCLSCENQKNINLFNINNNNNNNNIHDRVQILLRRHRQLCRLDAKMPQVPVSVRMLCSSVVKVVQQDPIEFMMSVLCLCVFLSMCCVESI